MSEQTQPAQPSPQSERPAWLPEKFSSPEQMAEAYAHLEQRMGAGEAPAPEAPAPTQAPVTETPSGPLGGIPETPAEPEGGVWSDEALSRYAQDITKTGDLSAEDRQALAAAGIPEAQINAHVAGWKAQQQLATQQILGITGGQDAYNQMVQWAARSIPAGEQQVFNAALNSGDVNAAAAATRGLWAQYQASAGNPMPNRGTPAPTTQGFASFEQLRAAQADPRYKSDPAFRAEVEARTLASSFFQG